MNPLLEAALQYAARGWVVLPLHGIRANGAPCCTCRKGPACKSAGKHPRLERTGPGHSAASSDPAQIEAWWRQWPQANVGIVTGRLSGIAVVDLDGVAGVALLAAAVAAHEPLPRTLQAVSGRLGGGLHLYYAADAETPEIAADGCDLRGDGGLIVAPPSWHVSGRQYAWVDVTAPMARMPAWLLDWFWGRSGSRKAGGAEGRGKGQESLGGPAAPKPAHLMRPVGDLTGRLLAAVSPGPQAGIEDVAGAVAVIPNPDVGWDTYNTMGMRIYAATAGSPEGRALFDGWSGLSGKHRAGAVAERWRHYAVSGPTSTGFGALVVAAREVVPGWEPPSRRKPAAHMNGTPTLPAVFAEPATEADSPLIKLNKQYAVIGDLGGKCLVLGWVPSKVDDALKVPSFQSFKSFGERYASQYVTTKRESKTGEVTEEPRQIGAYWLKWTGRRSYEGIDLEPGRPAILPGNVMNLWSGFALEPRAGAPGWPLMQRHIREVLAAGDQEAARYVARFAAWAVQHPGQRAEVALVFRGGKGSGKGTFANALRRLFGQHGLQIFNSKHLVGSFNGHLRNCLLLFADEAFWAGDKQGESVLKGMLTEAVLMIEQKGVDAAQWRNRLHVIMAANAEWVVPASHDERRYAMFDVSNERIGDRAYFRALHDELAHGGLEAMLWDLQHAPLGDWHPREIPHNEALRAQKERSLSPIQEWWLEILQNGRVPYGLRDEPDKVDSSQLLANAQSFPKLKELSPQALGRFLTGVGGTNLHTRDGNRWGFGKLNDRRAQWIKAYGMWKWRAEIADWGLEPSQASHNLHG